MKKSLSVLLAILGWLAIITQYYLMLDKRVESNIETTIRFFSFFTILTNILAAIYFTYQAISRKRLQTQWLEQPGMLTAITVYIAVVGLVYQFILRKMWEPSGLQMIVDELLHSVIPLSVVVFWFLFEDKASLRWGQIPKWLVYPLVYIVYIFARGQVSGFYPYPFVNVEALGVGRFLINVGALFLVFVIFSLIFVGLGKMSGIKNKPRMHE